MRVMKVAPQKKPQLVDIENDLDSLQIAVGGYIQVIYPFNDMNVALICDEEGKMNGKKANRVLRDEEGRVYDIIVGTFIVAGTTDEDFCDLSDEQIEKLSEVYGEPEYFIGNSSHLVVVVGDKTEVLY